MIHIDDNDTSTNDNTSTDDDNETRQPMDYAMHELLDIRNSLKECKTDEEKKQVESFIFFKRGGSGQCYTPEHVKVMREIIALEGTIGPFVHPVNKYQDTALILAAIHRDYEFMKLLMENGADPSKCRYDGKCAADFCDIRGLQIIMEGIDKKVDHK